MLSTDGGLGLQSLLDFTQKCKLKMLLRNINKNDDTGKAFQGLVARALRDSGAGGFPAKHTIGPCLSKPGWMTSIVDWLAKMGLFIEVQGPDPLPSHLPVSGDRDRLISLYDRGISLEEEESTLSTLSNIPLRVGQCWHLRDKVYEVVAFAGDCAECLEWTPSDILLSPQSTLTLDPSDNYRLYPKGMGTDIKIPLVDLLKSRVLVERSPDKVTVTHKISQAGPGLEIVRLEALSSLIVTTRNRCPSLPLPSSSHLPSGHVDISQLYFHSMYTDGSWTKTYSLPSLLLNSGTVVAGGAIVLHTSRGLLSIKVDIDVEVKSAFDVEVISLLIAHEMAEGRRLNIWSDCSSAIKCLNGGGLGAYSQLLSGWAKSKDISLCKVKAHPELRLPASEWSKEEQGNFLADKIAGGMVAPYLTISAKEWLKWIGSKSKIILTDSNCTPVILEPRLIKSKLDGAKYLLDRDNYRLEAGKTPCWKGSNIALHHKLMGRSKKIGDRVITQRIGLVKRWQWHSARKDNLCAGCNQLITGIDHPLRHCTNLDMIKARSDWWKGVEGSIMKCKRTLHEKLFTITRAMREAPGGEIA